MKYRYRRLFAFIISICLFINIWMVVRHFRKQEKTSYRVQLCNRLFSGDKAAIEEAESLESPDHLSDEAYVDLTKNCPGFITNRGYIMHPLSEEELNFPLAYSILMFKDVSSTERLLRAIYCPQNYYIIHVDSKATQIVKNAIKGIVGCFPNVFEAQNPYDVRWANVTLLHAELTCMRQLLRYKKWKYFINLTGQEFPLWSNRDIVQTLMAFKGANNIEGKLKKASNFHYRYNWVYNNSIRTGRRKSPPPFNLTMIKGSIHILGSRRFIEFALNDARAIGLLKWLEDTLIPDEMFFSTLNYNHALRAPGGYQGPPDEDETKHPFLFRYVQWLGDKSVECKGGYVREVCIFGVGSLQQLVKAKQLFANKFHKDYHPFALDCMEELIRRRRAEAAYRDYGPLTNEISKYNFVLHQHVH